MNFNWNELDNTLNVVEQLQATNSNKDKIAILEANKDDEMLQRVLNYTYDSFKKYESAKIKTNTFDVYTHQKKLLDSTDSTKYIYKEAKGLLLTLYNSLSNKQIRLLGVRVDNLVDEEEMQMSLFMNNNGDKERQKRVDYVVDELKDKYGYNMVTRAGKMNINKLIRLKE